MYSTVWLSAHLLLWSICSSGVQAVVRGVNMGGWLVSEPWIVPSLFNATGTKDEWHLCNVLGKEACLQQLQNHWSTFYTRDDLVQIKNAGLTAVRIPLGYWAVTVLDYEPYVSGAYPYLIQAIQWCQQLGLHAFIDLHGAPGSQNGWEESGLIGPVGFTDNSTNAQRTLNVMRNLTEEFSKDIYGGVVTNIELLNEPLLGYSVLDDFYKLGYPVVAAGNASGINVTISDGFFGPHSWENYDPTNTQATEPVPFLTVDTHQFWAFPPLNTMSKPEILDAICTFGKQQLKLINSNYSGIPPTLVGEWSLDTGITANSTAEEGETQEKRTWFRQLFEAQNAAFTPNGPNQPSVGWYFWAWKTEYDIDAWSYRKGLAYEYIPSNVSDPSTYVFPVNSDGCIDATFNWTAPATINPTTPTASSSPSATSSSSSSSSSKNSKQSSADSFVTTQHWMASWVVVFAITIFSFL